MFEHKGPLTYFINAAAAFVSYNSFIGLYLIEIISLTVFMIFAYKTACLFTHKELSFYAVMITVAIMLCSSCFLRGDNVEELCWPLMMISLYYVLRAAPMKQSAMPKAQSLLIIFVNGLLCGTVLWIKFNLIGYWIGWALVTWIPLLRKKKLKLCAAQMALFLLGIAVTALPWLIYFAYQGALRDFLYTYFYCNIFLYKESNGILTRLLSILIGLVRNLNGNVVLIAASVYGMVRLCKKQIYSPLITYIGLYAGVFFGGRWYDYYYLILAFYGLFGVIYVMKDLKNLHFLYYLRTHVVKGTVFLFAVCLSAAILCSNCYPYYGADKDEYPQFQFASYISQSGVENPTLLNYNFIDQGFYYAAGISPVNKYFCRVNIPYSALPEMYDEQKALIDNKRVDFVVVRMFGRNNSIQNDYISSITTIGAYNYQTPSYAIDIDNIPLLFENYNLVLESRDIHDDYVFGLFQKK